MNKYGSALEKTGLFDGVSTTDMEAVLHCLGARTKAFGKNTLILNAGDQVKDVGIVLSGRVQIMKTDEAGNKAITTEKPPGHLFGEALACANVEHSPVAVMATEPCDIMFIGFKKIITVCSSACAFHTRLIENMLKVIARENLMLNEKLDILTQKTTGEKLAYFLRLQKEKAGKPEFTIPFNREELADFLSVNRSAMSRELSRMRDDGLIDFERNRFHVKNL